MNVEPLDRHGGDPSPALPLLTAPVAGVVVLLLTTAFALVGLAASSPASAHGTLVMSDPAEDALVEALPSRASLLFSVPVDEVREITVTGPEGGVTNGAPTTNGPEVRQALWAGPDGAYTMDYHVVTSDGHELQGEVSFEIGPLSAAADDGPAATGARPSDAARSSVSEVLVPALVVLVAGAVALALTRLRVRGRTPEHPR